MKNDLVFTSGENVWTDSLVISKQMGFLHKHIIKNIENLTDDLSSLKTSSIFKKSRRINTRGREYEYYILNRPAFSLLMMRFHSKRAFEWQNVFNEAFYAMERALLNQQNTSWIESRDQGKLQRRELTDTIKNFVDYSTEQGNVYAKFYYATITKIPYKALKLIDENKSTPVRDLLNRKELSFLELAELKATEAIQEGMDEKMHYKDIFQLAKKRVDELVAVLPIKETKLLQ